MSSLPRQDGRPLICVAFDELIADTRAPWPSDTVSDEMMMTYSSDPNFVSVFVDSPQTVRIVLKGEEDRMFFVSGVQVSVVGAKYSLEEMFTHAETLQLENPRIHEVSIDADTQQLEAVMSPGVDVQAADVLRTDIPDDVGVYISFREREQLAAAQGGETRTSLLRRCPRARGP